MKILRSLKLMTMAVMLTVISCVQEDENFSSSDSLVDDIGYWHNIAVSSVFDNKVYADDMTRNLSYYEIREMIIDELSKKEKEIFDYSIVKADLSWSDKILKEKQIIIENLSDKARGEKWQSINYEAVFNYLYDSNEIGDELYSFLIDLNKKIIDNKVSRDQVIELCLNMKDQMISDRDANHLSVFNQILYNSNIYWSDPHAKIQDERTVAIIWADAAGGLYGLLCGPVCSIIEAAAFSTLMAIQ